MKLQISACNDIEKETLAQVFSWEFCDIFKNVYSEEQLRTAASEYKYKKCKILKKNYQNFLCLFDSLIGLVVITHEGFEPI